MPDLMRGHQISPSNDLLERPIILIGAGRSGSTLFTRMLDSHPRIQFLGETNFLLPRAWREIWEDRFWFNFPFHMERQPRSSRMAPPKIDKRTTDTERQRVAALIRRLFGDILRVRGDVEAWGYKEIWNGNEAVACFSWSCYDIVFPKATWVHLVRHPFEFVKSVARWDQIPLTEEFVIQTISRWSQMIAWNRQQSTRKNFIEIRYEDLRLDPKKALFPVFSAVGVDWNDDCLNALSSLVMHSREASPFPIAPPLTSSKLNSIVAEIENLDRYLDELGYDIPEEFPQEHLDYEISDELPSYFDLRNPAPNS